MNGGPLNLVGLVGDECCVCVSACGFVNVFDKLSGGFGRYICM